MALVNWWPLLDDFADAQGTDDLTGVASGEQKADFIADAEKGLVCRLDGGGYATRTLMAPTIPFTYCLWIKTTEVARDFLGVGESDAADHWLARTQAGGPVRWVANEGGANNTNGAIDITDDAWHFVAVTAESSTVRKIYVDGVLDVTSSATAKTPSVPTPTLYLGRGPEGTTLDILCFGLRYYDTALDLAGVQTAETETDRAPIPPPLATTNRGIEVGVFRR